MKSKTRKSAIQRKSSERVADPRLTSEQYLNEDESNIEEEFRYRPARMERLPRGEFRRRHPGFDPTTAKTKVRITIHLDLDVLNYFKARAAQPNAAPYQTQINQALCEVMERGGPVGLSANKRTPKAGQTAALTSGYRALLDDPEFIKAVAERVQVKIREKGRKRSRKAA